ncbi:protein FAM193B-like isoform X1 [Oncorhynchus keta]|uniref:protein FAM193B-like isoform X1 n=2 Tax=Oncorhynchus keta TaxID=8018 RepID=UPI00227BDDDF|nr:protein FAM193B-like isoform X1 [Oncorhynchus keta]
MARKKNKQQGVGSKELVSGQQSISKSPVPPGDAAGGDAGLDRLAARANQPMHTCCLLCHREFKDWGASSANGLPGGHGAKLADAVPALSQALLREVPGQKLSDTVPSLSQSLLGEVPLWICQSCRKSVEEEERRSAQETAVPVPLSHSSSCRAQSCSEGYPEQSSVDWDPSSFLSAHKLSGLWNSAHNNGGIHCNHSTASHAQQGTGGPACHEKRVSHEAPGKSAKTPGAKVCPYSHPSQNSSGSSPGNPLSTSGDLCKTTPKHFKTMCRRPTPPGEAFHPSDHHQHSDLSVPPNSPTGLSSSSQHSSLLPLKQSSGGQQHGHVTSSSSSTGLAAHAPFSPLVPNLHVPAAGAKLGALGGPDCSAGAKLGALGGPDCSAGAKLGALGGPDCPAGAKLGALGGPDCPTGAKLGALGGPDCSAAALHKPLACKNSHIPPVNGQHSKLGPSQMGCNHPCNGHSGGALPSPNVGHLTAGQHLTAGACRDQACKGHKLSNGAGGLCHPPSELEEGEDEDSSSERSSCASSSNNQKDGKYCDCCYCEFFGHNAPPVAPTSRNYTEIREKLRSRLTRRKEECLPQRRDSDPAVSTSVDHRDVDELLDFINSSEHKPANSAKAAKRARHKQKKKEKQTQAGSGDGEGAGSDPPSTPPEPSEDPDHLSLEEEEEEDVDGEYGEGPEASRLLEWPQLELERVNSFLTSRLEEIKNTIKDSIRASFSMYDLNLDVNDFPKKAATLEGNHLLSHLNGSSCSDLQQIDLDLAPLSLGTFKSHLDLVSGWEEAHPRDNSPIGPISTPASTTVPGVGGPGVGTGGKDVHRLHTTPSLSKLIRVRSPERCPSARPENKHQAPASIQTQASIKVAKPKEETPAEPKNITTPTPGVNVGAGKNITTPGSGVNVGAGKNITTPGSGVNVGAGKNIATPGSGVNVGAGKNITTPGSGVNVGAGKNITTPGSGVNVGAGKNIATPGSGVNAGAGKNIATPGSGVNAGAGKLKKGKKQQRQDQLPPEQNQTRPGSKAAAELQKTGSDAVGSKAGSGSKPPPHSAESQRTGARRAEETRPTRQQATNGTASSSGTPSTQRGKGEEQEAKGHSVTSTNHNQAQQQPKGKNKKNKNKGEKTSRNIDDVFLPKDVDPKEMDEIDREVEYFKRFCLDSAKQTRQKVAVNWSNFTLK